MRGDLLDPAAVAQLLPMHLMLDDEGGILGCGPTLRKLIGRARRFEDAFDLQRPHAGEEGPAAALASAARGGDRVFLRLAQPPHTVLRGHGTLLPDGRALFDFGFGIGVAEAVQHFGLTDADFAPADLVMELLFLHEANAAVLGALAKDNAQLDEQRQAAESRAFTDPLTGLANRRGLAAARESALRGRRLSDIGSHDGRSGGQGGFAVLHLDLDGFKGVNDRHGHAAGDRVLQRVAAILREETRAGDAVARPGGDEFVLMLPGMVSAGALDRLARRIIERIEAPIDIGGVEVRISASIGVAVSTDYGDEELGAMEAEADAALYAAKRAGRGRHCRARASDGGQGCISVAQVRAAPAAPRPGY